MLSPGCHCVPWFCGVNVAGVLSLRIQQLDVQSETKSKVMVLVTQYFDTMKEISASSKNSTVFIPHGHGAVHDVVEQIHNGLLQGQASHMN